MTLQTIKQYLGWSFLTAIFVLATKLSSFGQETVNNNQNNPQAAALPKLNGAETELESTDSALRVTIADLRNALSAWTNNAAEANAEAELFRRQYETLRLRIEAIGLASYEVTDDKLERRLLRSVRDLGLMKQKNEELQSQLIRVTEAVIRYLDRPDESERAQIRMIVETNLRAANEVLGVPARNSANDTDPLPSRLQAGSILSYKENLSLIVTNLGRQQGVRVGMPITLARGDAFLGRARVIDVRDKLSGAIVEEEATDFVKIKVGDQARVKAFN